MCLTFKGICRKAASICVLLQAEAKHLYGRTQARVHAESGWVFGEQNQLSIASSVAFPIRGHAEEVSCCFLLALEKRMQKFISKKQRKGAATRLPFCP